MSHPSAPATDLPRFQRRSIYYGPPSERVLCVTGDITGNGNDDIVIGSRVGGTGLGEKALYWYGRDADGQWRPHLMDDDYLSVEAGGFLADIDGDGRLDFVAGSDGKFDRLYWWQRPDDPTQRWRRFEICQMPAKQSHDQIVADLDGDGRAEVYFWNQRADALMVVRIPDDPTQTPWPDVKVLAEVPGREESFAVVDIDGDGRPELIAGQSWYRCTGPGAYEGHRFAEGFQSMRVAAADFRGNGQVEIIVSEGDASLRKKTPGVLARLTPGDDITKLWRVQILHDNLADPHSLVVGDFDGDGRPDLFVGELGSPRGDHPHPPAQRIYFNRGGELIEQVIDQGIGTHEAKLIHLDGKVGIAGKPYRNYREENPEIERDAEVDAIHLWVLAGR